MLTANVSKIKKNVLPNLIFILNVLSENGIIFVWMVLSFKINNNVKLKNVF